MGILDPQTTEFLSENWRVLSAVISLSGATIYGSWRLFRWVLRGYDFKTRVKMDQEGKLKRFNIDVKHESESLRPLPQPVQIVHTNAIRSPKPVKNKADAPNMLGPGGGS